MIYRPIYRPLAVDSAVLSANVYSSTAAGLSATTEGDYFSVPSAEDSEYLILYRHDAGPVATEVKRYPSAEAVTPSADNMASLRDITGNNGRDYLQVKFHTSDGDGGGGNFYWASGEAPGTYVDDNGITIVPTGGDGSAAWLRDFSGECYAGWFGAVGNGVTDDTAVIKAGIGASAKELLLSPGKTYFFESLHIRGDIYSRWYNTGEVDLTRTSAWDSTTREYIDADGHIWRLDFRGGALPLPNLLHDWDCSQIITAIRSGAATVTAVGTSITEGVQAQAEPFHIWFNRLKYELQQSFPTVTWTFKNLGLNSRRLSDYVSDSYLALSSEPSNKRDGFWRPTPGVDASANVDGWPDGVTVGNSWKKHVEDTAPDLFVIAMGMNDITEDDVYATDLRSAITHAQGLATPPSIVLVTEMSSHQSTDNNPEDVKAYARVTRYVARTHGLGLIDNARWWQYLRLGLDECQYSARRMGDLTSAEWEEVGGTFAERTANTLDNPATTIPALIKRGNYCGASFQATFQPDEATAFVQFSVHISGAGAYIDDSITVRRNGNRFTIYDKSGSALVSYTGLPTVAGGVNEYITIRVIQNRVECWKEHTLIGTYFMENCGYYGGVGISMRECRLASVQVDIAIPKQMGMPVLDDDELTGRYGDWNSGNYEDGGNNLNHPSRLGLAYSYQGAIGQFMEGFVPVVISAPTPTP